MDFNSSLTRTLKGVHSDIGTYYTIPLLIQWGPPGMHSFNYPIAFSYYYTFLGGALTHKGTTETNWNSLISIQGNRNNKLLTGFNGSIDNTEEWIVIGI